MIKNVFEIIKDQLPGTINADLIYKKVQERGHLNITEGAILQSLDLLRKMRAIEATSESAQEFRLTEVGLEVQSDLVEKTVRLYMERNMCQDSRVVRS